MHKSLALICSLMLFTIPSVAAEKLAYQNNLLFSVDLMLGTDNYLSGTPAVNLLNLGYNSPNGALGNNLMYGAGLHFSYQKRHFAALGDILYRQGQIMGVISGTNSSSAAADLNAGGAVSSTFKTKLGVGYAVILNNDAVITPFVGASFKTKTHNIPAITVGGTAAAVNEVNTLFGIPLGMTGKAHFSETIGLEVYGAYHLLWSVQTSTTRTATNIGATNIIYSETGRGIPLSGNYSVELGCNVNWLMSESDFGLTSLGLGAYYNYDNILASIPNPTILPAITTSEYGVILSFSF